MARTQKEVTKIKLGNYLRKTIEVYENQSENDFCRGASAALGMVLFMLTTKEYDIEVTETAEMCTQNDRLLRLGAMARSLRVTTAWLEAEAVEGRIPCLKAGATLLFNPRAVEVVLSDGAARMGPTAAS